jgi:hypothetical protein
MQKRLGDFSPYPAISFLVITRIFSYFSYQFSDKKSSFWVAPEPKKPKTTRYNVYENKNQNRSNGGGGAGGSGGGNGGNRNNSRRNKQPKSKPNTQSEVPTTATASRNDT